MSRPRYTNAELEWWGDVFVAGGGPARFGMTFEQFLVDPARYLARKPITPVAPKVEREVSDLPRQHGAPFEKLTHHAWPRRRGGARFEPSEPSS